ncbi:MAG: hypothetical protein WCE94_15310 [Candidatus Methanoperedens sp.]
MATTPENIDECNALHCVNCTCSSDPKYVGTKFTGRDHCKQRQKFLRGALNAKVADEKPTIDCPHCFAQISHVEVTEERHGVMDIGKEIEYDLNSENNGAPKYFCPVCQEEIEEVELTLVPEPAEVGT